MSTLSAAKHPDDTKQYQNANGSDDDQGDKAPVEILLHDKG
jgi:hypothetical protein